MLILSDSRITNIGTKFYKNNIKAMITRITVTLSEVEMHLFNSKMSNIS